MFEVTLDLQNPPVIPDEDRRLEPLKAKPREMIGGSSHTDPHVRYDRMSRV